MECAEIRSDFVAGRVPTGPEVEEHLQGCAQCRELFQADATLGRRLAQAVSPQVEAPELFLLVERELKQDVGVRARLRALPTRLRAFILSGVALLLLGAQLAFRCRPDFAEYEPSVFWSVAALLGVPLGFGAWRLLRGASTPLWIASSERWLIGSLLLLPFGVVTLVPLGTSSPEWLAAWGHPSGCFVHGALLSAPIVLIYWLFERRDSVPVSSWVMAGALAGICANLLLHALCPSAHLGHLLVGHATIGVAWALLLALLARPRRRTT